MSKTILIIALFYFNFTFSQKSKIILQSNLKHNYAIGKDYYVEDAIDTTRLLFMGVIQITSSNQDALIVGGIHLLKTKTKELNGNGYRLKSFETKDTTIIMLFDIYFVPDKQVELIKINRLKNNIIVFNNIKDTLIRRLVVNETMYSFKRNKSILIETNNKNIQIKIDTAKTIRYNDRIKQEQLTEFLTVKPINTSALIYTGAAVTGGLIGIAVATTADVLMYKNLLPSREFLSNLNYNVGRVLIEIYPLDNKILIP